jgi:Domain of unknown function (DUF4115)
MPMPRRNATAIDIDPEPPLAKYVLSGATLSRPLPLAEIEPISWDVVPERPRLVCPLLPEDDIENAPASEPVRGTVPKSRPSIPSWAALIAVAVIAISGFGILLFGRSVAAKDRPPTIPAASFQQPALPEVVAAPLRAAEPLVRKNASNLSVQASGRSWVVVCTDGKVLFSKLFTAGDRHTVKFTQAAVVRVGNAGSIQVVNDGEFTGALGRRGQVRIVEFTPDDSHFLHGGESEDCTYGR